MELCAKCNDVFSKVTLVQVERKLFLQFVHMSAYTFKFYTFVGTE